MVTGVKILMVLIIYLASIFATTILSGACTIPLFLNTKDDFSLKPDQKCKKDFGKCWILFQSHGQTLTWMAGPRGAGRLGVAAEGGAKPIGLYLSFFILNF